MSEDIQTEVLKGDGLYIGRRFKVSPTPDDQVADISFNSGGAGYVLDQVAVKKLGGALESEKDICKGNFFRRDTCDKPIGECLALLGIFATDSREDGLLERFHHFPPEEIWNMYYFNPEAGKNTWWRIHSFFSSGASRNSISFHWVKPSDMERIRSYLTLCRTRRNTVTFPSPEEKVQSVIFAQ